MIAASADAAKEHAQTLDFELVAGETDHTAAELDTPSKRADAEELIAAVREHLCEKRIDLTSNGGKDGAIELGLAIIGFAMDTASFPAEWRAGEYVGVVLTALAVGMLLARHFRRP